MTDPVVDTQAAAEAVQVKPATVRQWASRGHLERAGSDPKGRTVYRLADVFAAERERRR